MTSEELDSEIKLVFAKECAAAMRQHIEVIARADRAERESYAKSIGMFYASAYCAVQRYFVTGTEPGDQSPSSAAHTDQLNSTQATDSQSPEAPLGQA